MELYLIAGGLSLVFSVLLTALSFYVDSDDEIRKIAIGCVFVSFIPVLQFVSLTCSVIAILVCMVASAVEWTNDKLEDIVRAKRNARRAKAHREWQERIGN